jgi:hypothetical protein
MLVTISISLSGTIDKTVSADHAAYEVGIEYIGLTITLRFGHTSAASCGLGQQPQAGLVVGQTFWKASRTSETETECKLEMSSEILTDL